MKNSIQRLLFVGLTLPVLIVLIVYVPHFNHAPLAFLLLLFCTGSCIELLIMMEPVAGIKRKIMVLLLSVAPAMATYVSSLYFKNASLLSIWLVPSSIFLFGGFFVSAIPLALPKTDESILYSVKTLSYNAFYIIYPGMFSSAIMAILCIKNFSTQYILWFLLIVFGNDSLAWFIGMTLGRKRKIFLVSPKKSLEGLIAGMSGSIIAAFLGPVIFKQFGHISWTVLSLIGLLCGSGAVIGDLLESAIKRSCGAKDSGYIVPGRGGILDSFDSLLFTAPIFLAVLLLAGLVY